MIVEEYGICPNCGVETEGMLPKYCHDCGTALEWKERAEYFPPRLALSAEPKLVMRHGTINCTCGQQFYFESLRDGIQCIQCQATHDTLAYPEKEELVAMPLGEGEEDGTDI